MITKEQSLVLIREHVKNENIVKHMLAVGAMMGGVYEELKKRGRAEAELGGQKEEWMIAGLLHDGDYCEEVPHTEQGIKITEWAREKGYQGHFVPVVGYDKKNVYVHNHGLNNPLSFLPIKKEIFEEARKAKGTDEDIIVVHRKI